MSNLEIRFNQEKCSVSCSYLKWNHLYGSCELYDEMLSDARDRCTQCIADHGKHEETVDRRILSRQKGGTMDSAECLAEVEKRYEEIYPAIELVFEVRSLSGKRLIQAYTSKGDSYVIHLYSDGEKIGMSVGHTLDSHGILDSTRQFLLRNKQIERDMHNALEALGEDMKRCRAEAEKILSLLEEETPDGSIGEWVPDVEKETEAK